MLKVHELPMSIGTLSRTITRQVAEYCKKYDITAYQYVVLFYLAEGKDGVTQQELVKAANSDANTIRAMLILLEKHGMIKRKYNPKDIRKRHITITKKGQETYRAVFKDTEHIRKLLNTVLSTNEHEKLMEYINRLQNALDELKHQNENNLKK